MFEFVCIRRLCSALCLGVLSLAATDSQAKSFALLVGVSDYDESIGLADLRGPSNDVILLRDVLNARDDFDIRMLADGVVGATRPTRNAILQAFEDIIADTASGDFVYIHMSGHGTQQADRSGDETDGMDEVFLPADTMRAEPGTSTIPNAIVDEELGQRIAALRKKGVDVWFVLDSCHSGSGLRAGSPRTQARFVDPATLGVTAVATPQPASTSPLEGPGDDALPGKYLAFYAAQSSEVAREIEIDQTAENGWYGLFTSRLAARIQSEAKLSFRQLFQAVLTDLNDASVPGGARLQTPLWEGNLIDAPVFGGGSLIGVRQFALDGNRLQAGLLHGLTDNATVALVSDAVAASDAILAYAQLEDVDARTAGLAAVRSDCVALVDTPCARAGSLPQEAKFARLVGKPRDAVLRIAPPVALTSGDIVTKDNALAAALEQAIEATNTESGTNIILDPKGGILTGIKDGRLWIGPKIASGASAIGLSWAPEDGDLGSLLVRISKAEDMAHRLSNVAGTPSLLFPSPIEISVQRMISDASRLETSTPSDLRGECLAAQRTAVATTELGHGQSVKQCDLMAFGAKGLVQGPARDVNRIYIDSQYCVSAEYQRVEGVSKPAVLGQPITFCSDCPGPDGIEAKAGAERMFIVITEAEDNREALNLEGLVENCVDEASATRSGSSQQIEGFFEGLSNRDATRGGMGGFGISHIWVEEFSWQVLPRSEALAEAGLAAN